MIYCIVQSTGDAYWIDAYHIFPIRPLSEIREVRVGVRGSERAGVRVRILELSATTGIAVH
jgi:hypothetical protein